MKKESKTNSAKEVVLAFLTALNNEDFISARKLAKPEMIFDGVLARREGAEAYFKDMEKMKMKYDIKKVFEDGDDVCILSDIKMGDTTLFTCSWYRLSDGLIANLKVVFDPRPALDKGQK